MPFNLIPGIQTHNQNARFFVRRLSLIFDKYCLSPPRLTRSVHHRLSNTMSSKNSKTTQPAEDTRRWHFTLHPSVQLVPETLTSVFTRFAHPTRAVLSHSDGIDLEWRSRSHRKHRYRFSGPSPPTRAYQKLLNLFKVEYWNISWWVAWVRAFLLHTNLLFIVVNY